MFQRNVTILIPNQADLTKEGKSRAKYNFYTNNQPLSSFLNVKTFV